MAKTDGTAEHGRLAFISGDRQRLCEEGKGAASIQGAGRPDPKER